MFIFLVNDVHFPPTIRPNFGEIGITIRLKVNFFEVQIPDKEIHHYDVEIYPDNCPRRVNR